MGELVGVLVQSLRNRFEKNRQDYGIEKHYTYRDGMIVGLIRKKDLGEITDDEFRRKMADINKREF
jgi:hypothetical protein